MKRLSIIFVLTITSLLLVFGASPGDVIINEFATETYWGSTMGLGGVDGRVELYNTTGVSVDLSSWTLEFVLPSVWGGGASSMTLSGTVNSGSYSTFTILDSVFNSCSEQKGYLILKDDLGNIIDQVYYGTMGGCPAPGFNVSTFSAYSVGRINHIDTDDYANDFGHTTSPTFGSANSNISAAALGSGLVINEVMNLSGSNQWYIEIYNPTSSAINMNGWYILIDDIINLPNQNISSGGFYTVEYTAINNANDNLETQFNLAQSMYLFNDSGVRVDQLGWDSAPGTGSISRMSDAVGGEYHGYNDISNGFIKGTPQTKDALNVAADSIKINEFVIRPDGSEFIELANSLAYTIEISSWSLDDGTLNDGTTIPASGYAVITSSNSTLVSPFISDSGETLVLSNYQGTEYDRVSFGDTGGAPKIIDNYSVSRSPDFSDTDDFAADFNLDSTPTPGAINNGPASNLGGSTVVINEVNPTTGEAFIELYNTSAVSSVDITGWYVVSDAIYTIPATSINTDSYYVIEESSFPTGFNLSDISGNIFVYDSAYVRLDQMGWDSISGSGQSWSRLPNGTGGNNDGYDNTTSGFTLMDLSKGINNEPAGCDLADTTAPYWTPAGQSGIQASAGDAEIDISWNPADDDENPDSIKYTLYRSTSTGFTPDISNQLLSDITATYYKDNSVSNGTTYYYKVGTYNCDPTITTNNASDETSGMPEAMNIYGIQFNDSTQGTGDDCYPSSYKDEGVTITGVVTATGFAGDRYFLADPGGGLWAGVYVYDTSHSPAEGDLVTVSAQVQEYFGYTELGNVSYYSKIGTDSVPTPIVVQTGDIGRSCDVTAEQYEGVLVRVENLTVVSGPDSYNEWQVTDGSGNLKINDGFGVTYQSSWPDTMDYIIGMVEYNYGEYKLNPRTYSDVNGFAEPTYSICEVQDYDSNGNSLLVNNTVTIQGTAIVESGVFQPSRTSFWIQDDNGCGVNIFGFDQLGTPITRGDIVKVKGEVDEYNGLTEVIFDSVSDIQRLGSTTVPEPNEIQTGYNPYEEIEGTLVKVSGTVSGKWSYGFDLNDGSGPIMIYISSYDATGIDFSMINDGDQYTAIGIVTQYDSSGPEYLSGYEIIPRNQDDLFETKIELVEAGPVPAIFSPDLNESTDIGFNAPEGSHVIVRIYNIEGRMVDTLFDGTASSKKLTWKGFDEFGKKLDIGPYIINIIISDPQTGRSTAKSYPVVIATPLK